MVLKAHMHCEACAEAIKKRILRMKGDFFSLCFHFFCLFVINENWLYFEVFINLQVSFICYCILIMSAVNLIIIALFHLHIFQEKKHFSF